MSDWNQVGTLESLSQKGYRVVRKNGRQIALFLVDGEVRACNNRCPHEGYPLSEGTLDDSCVLTCNWHNWKFDLRTGENLYGGDRLRVYPVQVKGSKIWVDMSDPDPEQQRVSILKALHEAFDDNDYPRLARELARLERLNGDPLDALREAVFWSYERLEFGWTHAYAGVSDWLHLYDLHVDDPELRLSCLLESIAHIADDVLRQIEYPYCQEHAEFSEQEFIAAIEREDEPGAIALLRGGLAAGLQFDALERSFTRAALAHYSDFGHSLIYVSKAADLISKLGDTVHEPVLLSLTRSLVYARREDLIPEFRGYASSLSAWGGGSSPEIPNVKAFHKLGIDKALEKVVDLSCAPVSSLYSALLGVNAANMLGYDIACQDKVRVPVSDNVGWLDFTHGITFSNAVRRQCEKYPQLWPQGLLQIACFAGRNAAFTDSKITPSRWHVPDPQAFFRDAINEVFDHGRDEFIVSVHILKTLLATREEFERETDTGVAELLLCAMNRFLHSPLKRKHVRRTVHQAMVFVERDA